MKHKIYLILANAGCSNRFNNSTPKQYNHIDEHTVLWHCVNSFAPITQINTIYITSSPNDYYIDNEAKNLYALSDKIIINKIGGANRAQTVLNSLLEIKNIASELDWVIIHDVARCCIDTDSIRKFIVTLESDLVGGIMAIKSTDTIKKLHNNHLTTINRDEIYLAQTPQMFRYGILTNALLNVDLDKITDEASAIEQLNYPIKLVLGSSNNIKITYPKDFILAKILCGMK